MPKNAQGSWVGKTASPTFQTYQTAGQLPPVPSSNTPTSVTPPPPVTPPLPSDNGSVNFPMGDLSNLFIGDHDINGLMQRLVGTLSTQQTPQVSEVVMTPERERLVSAVMNSGKKMRGAIPGKF